MCVGNKFHNVTDITFQRTAYTQQNIRIHISAFSEFGNGSGANAAYLPQSLFINSPVNKKFEKFIVANIKGVKIEVRLNQPRITTLFQNAVGNSDIVVAKSSPK